MTHLLSARDLSVQFKVRAGGRRVSFDAVSRLSLSVRAGETLGIVGESGCGKSTLARALMGLVALRTGEVDWQGQPLVRAASAVAPWPRSAMQMIFQDPLASLNPRMTVAKLIAEPLLEHAVDLSADARRAQVLQTMRLVGLREDMLNRYPHEFSGGQCQRIGIARALVCRPKLLICDEPVSALDVSIRAQIVNLLKDLQRRLGLALVFITHDLAVLRQLADRVMVMYLGRCVEIADKLTIYQQPRHPYTQMLLASVPGAGSQSSPRTAGGGPID
jgi:oligopeptide transport system ATP-binding protein